MDHLSVTYVDPHMSAVADDIARLGIADRHAGSSLCRRGPWKRDPCHCVTVLYQPGAVKPYPRRCPPIYIRDTKLAVRRVHDRLGH